jgi:hypothetical protein
MNIIIVDGFSFEFKNAITAFKFDETKIFQIGTFKILRTFP